MKFTFDLRRRNEKMNKDHTFGVDHKADLAVLLNECKLYLPNFNEEMIRKAFNMSYTAHLNKLRKSGEPFYTHPLEVARIVINEIPLDDTSVAAALLHNVVDESDKFTLQDIRHEFGPAVAQIVDGVSKIKYVESQHINSDSQIENYRLLLLALFKDVRIILIKLADRLHNMRTLENLTQESQLRASSETLSIYAPFANRFGLRNIKWELEDLAFKYLHNEDYESIKASLMQTREEREEYIERLIAPINFALESDDLLKKVKLKFELTGRPKHIYSIYHKTILRQKSIDELYDLFAIRLILDTKDKNMCFYIYGIIAGIYPPVPETFKDYISSPKKNGYQSIHTAVVGPDSKPVEVQIRTKIMHLVSEKGVAAHFNYKRGALDSESVLEEQNIQSWMDVVREIFENAGNDYTPEVLDAVRRKLFQDEIYVFTPANEFRKLPKGSTALDFAFDIHSKIGNHAIGAKINGRVVPLHHLLQNGDRIEILTSKNENPSKDWLKWVVTSKANQAITKYFKDEERRIEALGKDIWKKKSREQGFNISVDDFDQLLKVMKFNNSSEFFYALGDNSINFSKIYDFIKMKIQELPKKSDANSAENFSYMKSIGINIEKYFSIRSDTVMNFNICCKPLPGDEIVGIMQGDNEVVIHNSDCKSIEKILRTHSDDIVKINWSDIQDKTFKAEIRIIGEDREFMLQDITTAIIKSGHTNINSVNLNTFDTLLDGVISLKVDSSCNIESLFDAISEVDGVRSVERI